LDVYRPQRALSRLDSLGKTTVAPGIDSHLSTNASVGVVPSSCVALQPMSSAMARSRSASSASTRSSLNSERRKPGSFSKLGPDAVMSSKEFPSEREKLKAKLRGAREVGLV